MNEETMSTFDPDSFMNSEVEEALSTEYVPIPEGDYQAVIDKATPKVTPNGNALIEVHWKIDAPGVDDAHEKTVRQAIWLDITGSGALETGKGKNVALGRLREALSQNVPGQRWNPGMLEGNVAKIKVKQRAGDDGAIYTDVKGVAKL